MGKIMLGGTFRDIYRKIRIGGVWKSACFKYRINGEWKEDGCGLTLYLPQPINGNTIDLSVFISANNPKNKKTIKVVNNYVQPHITTGDLSNYKKVTLINAPGAEIQANVASGPGLSVTSSLILNNQGYIRGGGGTGGDGGAGAGKSRTVTSWVGYRYRVGPSPFLRRSDTNPWYWSFAATTATKAIGNDPQTISPQGNWGDQGPCWIGASSSPLQANSPGFNIAGTSTNTLTPGVGGRGGDGQVYNSPAQPGVLGAVGTVVGTAGFNGATGYNNTQYVANNKGGDGGAGGTWGQPGASGTVSATGSNGTAGQSGGNAIEGSVLLASSSTIGNTSGSVV